MARTGPVRGEFLDITAGFLKPYDILDEGRCVRGIEGAYGRWWRPVWGEVRREEIPRGTFRVFRGDLPDFFCTSIGDRQPVR